MAERIVSQLNKKVLLIDKRSHIGGNCYDYKDENNILIHKYGPHLFHTNNKKVIEYLKQFTQWVNYSHEVLAFVDGKNVPIPFNINTLYETLPTTKAKVLEEKLLSEFEHNSKVPILELKKSIDKELQNLADFIYEKIFVHYTAKQWGMKPEDLDSAVTARVPVFIGRDNRYFNDTYQMMPKDGYTKLFKSMLNHKNIELHLNTTFKDICKVIDNKIYLEGKEFKGKVIFTGPIDTLFDDKFGALPYRSIDMKFDTIPQVQYQEKATVNYPNDYNFTRITEFKHIHPTSSPKTTILKEYPQEYIKDKNTPYYPIFTDANQTKYDEYSKYSKKFDNLILLGRLAEYKYYDMDDIVERALEVFEKEIVSEI